MAQKRKRQKRKQDGVRRKRKRREKKCVDENNNNTDNSSNNNVDDSSYSQYEKRITRIEDEEEEEALGRDNRVLSLYLIYNDCKDAKTRTYIGCVEDVTARLLQHNGITASTPKSTRKALGHWKLLCILLVPPRIRQEVGGTKKIKLLLRESRGVVHRIRHFVNVGKTLGLFCFLSESLLRENSPHGWDLTDLAHEYQGQQQQRQLFIEYIMKQCHVSGNTSYFRHHSRQYNRHHHHHHSNHHHSTHIPSSSLSLEL